MTPKVVIRLQHRVYEETLVELGFPRCQRDNWGVLIGVIHCLNGGYGKNRAGLFSKADKDRTWAMGAYCRMGHSSWA